MRDTVITKEQGFLGPYGAKLKVGYTQRMSFSAEDPGPFWLSTKEREQKRLDILLSGTKT